MNLYHTWIYEYILNASWFVWTVVIVVLGFNILSPIFIWSIMSGRPVLLPRKLKEGNVEVSDKNT
ncbi:hypothetical protein ACOI1C_21580 [Bacillus sp. DJP31]|uniref:hypothetical protein n=1 Tax=Bacillus sp. DJP31 TaxID=3409789 RepID=UPI003BB73A8A